jgi:FkbM family methyltransferase
MDTKISGIFFSGSLQDNFVGHQIKEIYYDKIYEPYLKGTKDLTIVDVGASGVTSYYFSQFAKKVVAVEPSKEHADALRKTFEFNDLKNVNLVQKALWTEVTILPLYHNNNKTMFSLHTAVADPSLTPETVETITFDKLFEDEGIEKCEILKLDVEGSEVEILSSEGFGIVAPKIDLIVGEIHSWTGRNPNQIKDVLDVNGFKLEYIPNDANIFIAKKK